MAEGDRERLDTLLNYWIEHNKEHADEFREWAEKAKGFAGVTVQAQLLEAAKQMDRATELLLQAVEELKGEKR